MRRLLPVAVSRVTIALVAAVSLLSAPRSLRAQQTGAPPAAASTQPPVQVESATVVATPLPPEPQSNAQHEPAAGESEDFITPHVTDGHHLEIPWPNSHLVKEIELPTFPPVHIGGMEIDLSPTKHVVFMLIAATLAALMLITAASSSKKQHETKGSPKGFAAGVEAMALYLRNEVVLPNVGHHGEKFLPFTLTLFYFILFCNLLGMIPYGSTATGNIAVTATLAILSALVVEVAGIRANGIGYLSTIFYWNKDLPIVVRVVMFFVMSPVEMVGKISKPFALTIRLFANMTAGHMTLLAIIGLVFTFQSYVVAPVPIFMATAISLLEIFVAFLQAFIFTLLTSVFIGQIREAHH
jgi:F-type H+-transporting ATPase subunit a